MSTFLLCGVVLIVAAPLAWFIKREGERSWKRHQQMIAAQRRREAFAKFGKACVEVQIVLVDRLTPALKRVTAEMAHMQAALRDAEGRS